MKTKNLLLFIPIFLLVLCNSSCKEKQIEQCNGFIEYSQLMKDYFLFKDSSYWIYKDSATGILDSFWVTDYEKQSNWHYQQAGRNSPCYEEYEYKINRNLTDKIQEVSLNGYHYNLGKDKEKFYAEFTLRGKNYFYRNEQRFSTIGYDSIWYETPNEGGYVYKISQKEVNNKIYKDIQFLFYYNPNPYDWVRKIYYARYIGAVKFEDEDGRVWELINYKVKQ